ncbi:MAG: tetratricopeptide repeat protein [Promethearchaeota archaeon]
MKELTDIALLQIEIDRYSEAKENLDKCLSYFKRNRDRLGQAATFGLLGTLFFKEGKYDESIENYKKAYEIYKRLYQYKEEIVCLKSIGNCYIKLRDFDKASDYLLEACAVASDNNDIYSLLDCLEMLIHIYETKKDWDVLLELYKKALDAFTQIKDQKGTIISCFNLGIIKKKFSELEDALYFFKKGTNVAINSNYSELIIKGLGYVGEILFNQGKIKEAIEQYIKALHVANKIEAKNAILQIKLLLNSMGLDNFEIEKKLNEYGKKRNQNNE